MTLDQWTDTVATMTPRQREAMAYALEALDHIRADGRAVTGKTVREYLTIELREGLNAHGLAAFYPG